MVCYSDYTISRTAFAVQTHTHTHIFYTPTAGSSPYPFLTTRPFRRARSLARLLSLSLACTLVALQCVCVCVLNAFAQFVILCNIFHHSRFYDVLLSHYFCAVHRNTVSVSHCCVDLSVSCKRAAHAHTHIHLRICV